MDISSFPILSLIIFLPLVGALVIALIPRRNLGAIRGTALLFALAHVPGLYMRSGADVSGHSANLLAVIAYAIAVLSPIGLGLGFVWARTRSLLLVVLLHALIDLLPGVSEFARTWVLTA